MATVFSPSTRTNTFAKFVMELGRELFGSYRPEKHYMRGPARKRGQIAGKAQKYNVRDGNTNIR